MSRRKEIRPERDEHAEGNEPNSKEVGREERNPRRKRMSIRGKEPNRMGMSKKNGECKKKIAIRKGIQQVGKCA